MNGPTSILTTIVNRRGGNMVIDGDDLHILMRSADANATNAHNSNLITFHTVKNFRDLEY